MRSSFWFTDNPGARRGTGGKVPEHLAFLRQHRGAILSDGPLAMREWCAAGGRVAGRKAHNRR